MLPDAEFTEQQAKLCSRFNERLPASPGGSLPAEPRSHQLRQTIASAKRKIRAYEEAFERRCGYRPSHADRAKDREVKRCLADLSRARRDLKALREEPAPAAAARAPQGTDAARAGKENRSPPEGDGDGEDERPLQRTVADVTRVSARRGGGGDGGIPRIGRSSGRAGQVRVCHCGLLLL